MVSNMPQIVRLVYLRKTTESAAFRWFLNIFLIILIFYNEELGRMLGIKGLPLKISAIWPATGFSLAFLLLFGNKMLPGIFLGNFAYNFYHLYSSGETFFGPFITACFVSSGSLLEAYLAAFIMNRYCTTGYFNTVKDVFIFLVPAGIFCSFLASVIGTFSLYVYGTLPTLSLFFYTGLTFWLGDMMGVYVITPLLYIWSIHRPKATLAQYPMETIFMVVAFVIITALSYFWELPVENLYIPLSIWATFRFVLHGATLSTFFITLVSVIATSKGFGAFAGYSGTDQLLHLIALIEIIVATTLLLAAVLKEREAAWFILAEKGTDFEKTIQEKLPEFHKLISETFVKEKLMSLGLITASIAKQLDVPLLKLKKFIQECSDSFRRVKNSYLLYEKQIEESLAKAIEKNLDALEHSLQEMLKTEGQIAKIAAVIQQQSAVAAPGRVKVKSIHVNTLMNICLLEVMKDVEERFPELTFTVAKEFDSTITEMLDFPEDLAHAFVHFLNASILSLMQKKAKLHALFTPELSVTTRNLVDSVEVVIQDNGEGVEESKLAAYCQSFVAPEEEEILDLTGKSKNLNLSLAYDIITYVYDGKVEVQSRKGEFLKFIITLPKK